MERLLKVKDLCEQYGFTPYEAQTVMSRVKRIDIGRGTVPRWVTTASAVEAYLENRTVGVPMMGLDKHGKLIRR